METNASGYTIKMFDVQKSRARNFMSLFASIWGLKPINIFLSRIFDKDNLDVLLQMDLRLSRMIILHIFEMFS